ncbi:DUF4279 domain-containing protein [Nocardia camponoti]|uniref:DUF4279 domain-containing protein n=1 Tax=Nocardia camponoti TaxID=1616106 RepID=A0A917VBX9_9NOCA|nr:DUF4279 domain-containing protein [Nocardia camponoti]GGK59430.1 hypothetical protein GCM10011591_34510 [Nocardia camponoti]
MKVSQYSYFSVESTALSAVEMSARLGMEPDEVLVMGSRSPEHVIPRVNAWKVVCRSDESVDDQIQCLVDRLAPIRAELVSLCADDEVSSVMQVVRYFGDPDGVGPAPAGTSLDRAREYPRPLGWHLPLSVLEFLASTKTELDVDEYSLNDDANDGTVRS